MSKPKLLDLFCCEGGAGKGYQDAGFDVTGVDIEPRFAKRYPGAFINADALTYLREHGHEYDAISASPPCQGYTIATSGITDRGERYPRLIAPVREALGQLDVPWVIENVVGAPLLSPLLLCGTMFGLRATDDDGTVLRLERHRLFESNILIPSPGPCIHDKTIPVGGVYSGGRSDRWEAKHVRRGGYTPAKHVRAELIGADWMTLYGLSQSIPPAYTEWIGRHLMDAITQAGAA